jgi:Phage integrase, N-terminal SAM-like domain
LLGRNWNFYSISALHGSTFVRNKNTRIAYYHAIGQFLDWCQRAGFRDLEDIEPITVAAYVEQHPGSPATIKQHMSAIRMLFSWLTEKGILAMNPAREVKTEKFSRSEGKTPAFDTDQVQKVLDRIDTSNQVGPAAAVPLEKIKRGKNMGQRFEAFQRWYKDLDTAHKVGLIIAVVTGTFLICGTIITGTFNLASALITTFAKPSPPPTLSASPSPTVSFSSAGTVSPFPTPTPSPTPEVPQASEAKIYYTSDGRVMIVAWYVPPQLRPGETLLYQAALSQNFDDTPTLLPESNIEDVGKGQTQGRLKYDPKDRPVWFRFIIIDAQGKPWYGKSVLAPKR